MQLRTFAHHGQRRRDATSDDETDAKRGQRMRRAVGSVSQNEPSMSEQGPTARAQTLRLQGLVNVIVRGLLRAPLLCRLVGQRLITVYVVGRRSGRHFSVPVAYTRHNGSLLVGTQFSWVRNLHSGQRVQIRLLGKRRPADVEVLTDETGVVEHFAILARDNHGFARFNKIGLDQNGEPRPEDLQLAWAAGARVAVLTPR